MALAIEEVRRLAELARLDLSSEELEKTRHDLQGILAYIDRIASVDTKGVPETEEASSGVVRVDKAFPSDDLTRQIILSNFPERTGDALQVPGVFDKPKS